MIRNRVQPRHALDYTPAAPPRRLGRIVVCLAATAVGLSGVAVASASTTTASASLGVSSSTATASATRSSDTTSRSEQREALTPAASASPSASATASDADAEAATDAASAADAGATAEAIETTEVSSISDVAALKAAEEAAAARVAAEKLAAEKKAAEEKAAEEKAAAKKAAAEKAAEEAASRVSLPVPSGSYRVSATFGQTGSWSSYHTGLDFAAGVGTEIDAIVAGTVVSDTAGSWSGTHVVIQAADGSYTLYCHMSSKNVEVGDKVSAGDKIGEVGETGRAFGAHLHLEYYTADQTPGDIYNASDPGKYLAGLGLDY